jgi:GT2 family glycosyltransferase
MPELQNPKWFTAIIPVILTSNIDRCLETLYKYTEKDSFYVYIIDQSVQGLDATALRNKYKNLMVIRTPKSNVHHTGNLGFAQATNLGITLVQTPYFMMLNDDVEFVHEWWQGVLETFHQVEEATPDNPAVIVCPASIRLADWSVGRADGDDFDILPYKEQYTEEEYSFLLHEKHYVNEHLTIQPDSVFDGVTMYACVCDTRRFLEVGMLDEKYFPGSGEDYDFSCIARMHGYRSVATTKSWVWHHWSSTFKALREEKEEVKSLQIPELQWNQNHEKWTERFDIWGIRCSRDDCNEIMVTKDNKIAICPKHADEVYNVPESTIMPL